MIMIRSRRDQRRAHRQRRVEQDHGGHLFARARQLLGNLVGGDAAAGEAADHVGPVRLHLAHLGDVVARPRPGSCGAVPRRP